MKWPNENEIIEFYAALAAAGLGPSGEERAAIAFLEEGRGIDDALRLGRYADDHEVRRHPTVSVDEPLSDEPDGATLADVIPAPPDRDRATWELLEAIRGEAESQAPAEAEIIAAAAELIAAGERRGVDGALKAVLGHTPTRGLVARARRVMAAALA